MNSQIDLTTFRRKGPPPENASAPQRVMVSPPRRYFARFGVPGALLVAFAAVGVYAGRGSLEHSYDVHIVMPSAGDGAASTNTTSSTRTADAAPAVSFEAPGWVEPSPFPITITARVNGVIRDINALEGQTVKAGQVIAQLYDSEEEIQHRLAGADVKLKEADYEAAKATWENPVELRQAIASAQAEQKVLEAEKLRAQHTLEYASKVANSDDALLRTGAEARLPAQKSALEAQQARADLAAIQAKMAANDVMLSSSLEKLRLRIDDKQKLALAEAALLNSKLHLEHSLQNLQLTSVISPTSGVVMRLYAQPGGMISSAVTEGMRIADIYDPQTLQVRAEVPIADAAKLRDKMPVDIQIEALPGRIFHGELARIVHQADVQRNTLPVKVKLKDPDPAIKPEMIARLKFSSRPDQEITEPNAVASSGVAKARKKKVAVSTGNSDALLIPSDLATPGSSEAQLWVAGADRRAHQRKITLGELRNDGSREALAGLTLSDKIIVNPPQGLHEGSLVRIAGE